MGRLIDYAPIAVCVAIGVALIGGVAAMVWDGAQYRREMACRDRWTDAPTAEECAKILEKARSAPSRSSDARSVL